MHRRQQQIEQFVDRHHKTSPVFFVISVDLSRSISRWPFVLRSEFAQRKPLWFSLNTRTSFVNKRPTKRLGGQIVAAVHRAGQIKANRASATHELILMSKLLQLSRARLHTRTPFRSHEIAGKVGVYRGPASSRFVLLSKRCRNCFIRSFFDLGKLKHEIHSNTPVATLHPSFFARRSVRSLRVRHLENWP